jgi:toxin ParE1/3/4
MSRIIVRARADREWDECLDYLARQNVTAARRFFNAVQQAIERLARMPGLGSPVEIWNPQLEGVRYLTIQGFRNYVVYYRPLEDGIEVLHIVHASRDVDRLFADDAT